MGLEQMTGRTAAAATVDYDRLRLRRFLDLLEHSGKVERRREVTKLSNVAQALEANPKCVLFDGAGREDDPLAGNVMGSRKLHGRATIGVSKSCAGRAGSNATPRKAATVLSTDFAIKGK